MKDELKPQFEVSEMGEADFDEANEMRMQSWRDTYPNEEAGVTHEWVEAQFTHQLSSAEAQARRERFVRDKTAGKTGAWVAKDASGKIVGTTTPYVDADGRQHVDSLYVAKDWQGTGVSSALMQKLIEWCDTSKPIELEVASYNDRAIAFYKKWSFKEVADSKRLHREMIPVIKMVRKGSDV